MIQLGGGHLFTPNWLEKSNTVVDINNIIFRQHLLGTFRPGLSRPIALPTLTTIVWPLFQGPLSNLDCGHLIAQCTCYQIFVALGPHDVEKTANQHVLQLPD
jgi:hypothetical protein